MKLARACQFAMCAGLAFVLSIALSYAQEVPLTQGQTIQVNVDRVNVGVIVTDGKGNFVQGLKRDHFHVFDNGVEQPIYRICPGRSSPDRFFCSSKRARPSIFCRTPIFLPLTPFLNGLSAGDRVAVGRYAEAPVAVLDFTAEKQVAQAALTGHPLQSRIRPVESFLQPEHRAGLAGSRFGKENHRPAFHRRGHFLATSHRSDSTRLQTCDVRILGVSVSGPMRNGKVGNQKQVQQTQRAFEEADSRLRALADATGGRAYFPQNAKAFPAIYKQMAQLIRNEYSLSFVPPQPTALSTTLK